MVDIKRRVGVTVEIGANPPFHDQEWRLTTEPLFPTLKTTTEGLVK